MQKVFSGLTGASVNVCQPNSLLSWISGLLGAGFGRFGNQEKLKQNPLQHLFEVSLATYGIYFDMFVCFIKGIICSPNIQTVAAISSYHVEIMWRHN